jgi:putative lipoprotein
LVASIFLLVLVSSWSYADDEWLARDKAAHAGAGAALGAGGYAAGALVFDTTKARTVTGAATALGVGAAKEWYDRGRGTPSWRDFAWDGIGAAGGIVAAWLIDRARDHRRTPSAAISSACGTVGSPSGLREGLVVPISMGRSSVCFESR